ncbi:MAG: hypothetical protein ACKVPX_06155 [Myxococcaceae bacterium]
MLHEFGHHFEDVLPLGLRTAVLRFREQRITGAPIPLARSTSKTLAKDEIAYPSLFSHPYVAKKYRNATPLFPESTEIVSMGLGHFATAESMVLFAIDDILTSDELKSRGNDFDVAHFEFTIGLILAMKAYVASLHGPVDGGSNA